MTTAASTQIVLREPASLPALRAADQGVADALESVLSENTNRVYGTQWLSIFMVIRPAIFTDIQPPWERGELTIIRL